MVLGELFLLLEQLRMASAAALPWAAPVSEAAPRKLRETPTLAFPSEDLLVV